MLILSMSRATVGDDAASLFDDFANQLPLNRSRP